VVAFTDDVFPGLESKRLGDRQKLLSYLRGEPLQKPPLPPVFIHVSVLSQSA
jgi:hypothetical protein